MGRRLEEIVRGFCTINGPPEREHNFGGYLTALACGAAAGFIVEQILVDFLYYSLDWKGHLSISSFGGLLLAWPTKEMLGSMFSNKKDSVIYYGASIAVGALFGGAVAHYLKN